MTQLTVEIPDEMMSRLQQAGTPLQEVVLQALEKHLQKAKTDIDITKSRTWELCGAFEVSEPTPEDIVGRDENGQIITNFAENSDRVIYRGK